MKYLRGFDLVLAAFGATMTITLGVVCIMYRVYIDQSPQMREEFPALLKVTLMFLLLAAAAGLAWQGLRRESAWRWPAQGALLAVIAGIIYGIRAVLLA
ncbi:MAG TPA: hypothetical protein VHE37_09600 [Nevskiaceae bacterium]|nr:hypothetical protein [Nevskiaceae bacterium]